MDVNNQDTKMSSAPSTGSVIDDEVDELKKIIGNVEKNMKIKKDDQQPGASNANNKITETSTKEDEPLTSSGLLNKLMGLIMGCAAGECFAADDPAVPWGYSTDQLMMCMKTISDKQEMHINTFMKTLGEYCNKDDSFADEYTKEIVNTVKNSGGIYNPLISHEQYTKYKKLNNDKLDGKEVGSDLLETADNTPLIRAALMGVFHNWEECSSAATACTHMDHRCASAAVVVAGAVHSMLCGRKTNIADIVTTTASMVLRSNNMTDMRDVNEYIRYTSEGYCTDLSLLALGKGYKKHVYKCMSQSMYALGKISLGSEIDTDHEFKSILTEIKSRKGDVMSNCALAGALMGCELGIDRIPSHMLKLVDEDNYDKLMHRIMDMAYALRIIKQKTKLDEEQ
jgi:hypothetical protein